jgi:hypothetical protein
MRQEVLSLMWLCGVSLTVIQPLASQVSLPVAQVPNRNPVTVARHHPNIVLDGDLADWQSIPFVSVRRSNGIFDLESPPAFSDEDLSFRFAVCHDNEALYVAVEVTDDAVRTDSSQPGATDALAGMMMPSRFLSTAITTMLAMHVSKAEWKQCMAASTHLSSMELR